MCLCVSMVIILGYCGKKQSNETKMISNIISRHRIFFCWSDFTINWLMFACNFPHVLNIAVGCKKWLFVLLLVQSFIYVNHPIGSESI